MSRKLSRLLRSAPAEVRDETDEQGWILESTRSGHVKWTHPNGTVVIASSTPGDHRAWANHLARMRRARTA